MNIRITFLLAFLLFLTSRDIYAQTRVRGGVLPSINYNHKINKVSELNFKVESRHFLYDSNNAFGSKFRYKYSLSDFSALAGRKVGLNSKIVLGVLMRLEPDAVSYRAIQQFIFQTKLNTFRVAHRIAADETFSSVEPTEFRLRYRTSVEIPLAGLKLDVREFYLKFNTEALNSIQDSEYDLEFRVVPNIGYMIDEQQKIELGLDNRVNSFIHDKKTQYTSWLTINWFL